MGYCLINFQNSKFLFEARQVPRWTSAASGQGFAEGEERARTKQQFSVGIVAVLRGSLPSDKRRAPWGKMPERATAWSN
ncbi:MAG: hypothetical protein CO031_02160 [Candidatus Nealsonbacteria bacterium CG_4_9_14_0_2_um_filter_37_38]|uniref:Uncharacterized protein n=1 Tax=Candidatus Nealsonbacteria bacterium CG_4_10_14_0_8_um_filter_37_14 TaxID=1974684 RepID=A0A2M7R5N7_9BACT|nr:MAG: hypothetical protein COV63_01975 [Candidatus Nealsonbacteria bacterium CG11_big_fil_rev_8_21_14_0_20_37_68]PIY88727.1 MAG: hypothetical protein COY73_03005 [Candidatus Nealsonbacteria bacterium CG_4_10_14_0_8_um_filter_37_14]PJC51523.1 MAG: hypothetical protein CO031_02160 [Candidatus Nealsonbacteria bacterium CG_4_9_14_0_2_um_filter_37_38]